MKRILQRIWFWIPFGLTCCAIVGLVAFGGIEVMQASKLEKRLDALNSRFATNGLVQAEDYELMFTNWASTNLVNYYANFVTNLSVYDTYRTNLTIEWVGKIVVGTNSPDMPERYRNSTARILDIELGLRSDGMVVWRDVKK